MKSSSQMFSVYKFYENPGLFVKSKEYTDKEDFQEVKKLVPDFQFYDAPEVQPMMMPKPAHSQPQPQTSLEVA